MIRLNGASQPYTPPWYKKGEGPVFMVRAGSVTERELFEGELSGDYDARSVSNLEMEQVFLAGIEHLLADSPDDLAALKETLTAEREIAEQNDEVARQAIALPEAERGAFIEKEGAKLPEDQRQTLEGVHTLLRRHWPDYKALWARRDRRAAILPLLAFRSFCTGWSGLETPFEAGPDGLVSEDAAAGVKPLDMKVTGLHAYNLLYAAGQEGNSARPSSSVKGRRTIRSDAGSRQGGRSKAGTGPRTPR